MALQSIDPGRFERLASHFVRLRYPTLIGHGLNAEGKPVQDPLDASDGNNVWVYHTTQADLAAKWLADGDQPGDLISAIARVDMLRRSNPSAAATVILATSRRVKSEVMDEVRKRAAAANIDIEVIDETILASWLDYDADGQYVRHRFFGARQELLDVRLLCAIGRLTIRKYRSVSYCPEAPTIARRIDDSLSDAIRRGDRMRFVVGLSGHGKTRALYSALRAHQRLGGVSLWIPPEIIQTAPRLENALLDTLRSYCPDLHRNAGTESLRLARRTGLPLVAVVDDLNWLSDPFATALKLASWGETAGAAVFVPLWPTIWEAFPQFVRDRNKASLTVDQYSDDEAIRAVQTRAPIALRGARELAKYCGNDPLLIGLLPTSTTASEQVRAHGVISSYIASICLELARRHGTIADDYHTALTALTEFVLDRRNLSPTIGELRDRFPPDSAAGLRLRELAHDGRLLLLEPALRFRHDRLRDALIAKYLEQSMAVLHSAFEDPFFAEPVGLALAMTDSPETLLDRISQANPIALAYATLISANEGGRNAQRIAKRLKTTIRIQKLRLGAGSYLEIDQVLTRLDSSIIFEVTAADPARYWRSRFVNGDPASAITFGNRVQHRLISDPEEWMARAIHANPAGIVAILDTSLQSNDETIRAAALTLLQYCGARIEAARIVAAFNVEQGSRETLIAALVAALHHPDPSALSPLLDAAFELPTHHEVRPNIVSNDRSLLVQQVAWRFKRLASPTLEALRHWAGDDSDREWMVAELLQSLPDADAVEYAIRAASRSGKFGQSLRAEFLSRPWSYMSERRLPTNVRRRVEAIWVDRTRPEDIRRTAWRYWTHILSDDDRIGPADEIEQTDVLWQEALRLRCERGDIRVRDKYLAKLKDDDSWLRFAAANWDNNVRERFFAVAGSLLTGQLSGNAEGDMIRIVAEQLRDIPLRDVNEFFSYLSEELYHPIFVVAALYTGTPHAMGFASQYLNSVEHPGAALIDLSDYFGFQTLELQERITPEQLWRLEPYLTALDAMDLLDLADCANKIGMREWTLAHVMPLLPLTQQARMNPTTRDHYRSLDEATLQSQGYQMVSHWVESFERRGEAVNTAMKIAKEWFLARGTPEAFLTLMNLV